MPETRVHGTCIAYGARAALLRGASGSGKSDLALRFLSLFKETDGETGAALVADDQTEVRLDGDTLIARAPDTIAGRMEVRGVGIVEVPHRAEATLALVVDLVAPDQVPRLPPDPAPTTAILGRPVPVVRLDPFEPSAPVKLKLALTGTL